MRRFLFSILLVMVCACAAAAQNKTIVLVRHAERASNVATEPDPDLSPEGRERSQALVKVLRKDKPPEIFSTEYKRTRQTVEPIAAARHKQVQIYDPAKHAELIDQIMKSKTEHYLVVGHSNSVPVLANLLV